MINHYFGSKDFLGAQVLALLSNYSAIRLPERLCFEDDPILYDIVSVRLMFNYLFERGYRQFYLDSLREDFFFKYLSSNPARLIQALKQTYRFQANDDAILLYSRYMPYMMEKTVVLKKEEGYFPSIAYDEIPYLICHTAMIHFIPEEDILARNDESKSIARELSVTLEDTPPDDLVIDFVKKYCVSAPPISQNPRSWLQHLSGVVPVES